MITVKDIADVLNRWAPPHHAESYDNVGLLTGHPSQKVSGIIINLDMTQPVIDEAIDRQCNMVIAHHPIWFKGRKRLIGDDYVSQTLIKAIRHDIALYAIHTNLDNQRDGVNQKIADKLGLQQTEILLPSSLEQDTGAGKIGWLEEPLTVDAFLRRLQKRFHAGGIRYAVGKQSHIHKVALCGGSGSFLTAEALRHEADAFVTADITYHKFFDNEAQMLLVDIGHYESEQFTSELISDYLSEKFPNFAIHLSQVNTNPVKYFF